MSPWFLNNFHLQTPQVWFVVHPVSQIFEYQVLDEVFKIYLQTLNQDSFILAWAKFNKKKILLDRVRAHFLVVLVLVFSQGTSLKIQLCLSFCLSVCPTVPGRPPEGIKVAALPRQIYYCPSCSYCLLHWSGKQICAESSFHPLTPNPYTEYKHYNKQRNWGYF